jgi:hypothetical protein
MPTRLAYFLDGIIGRNRTCSMSRPAAGIVLGILLSGAALQAANVPPVVSITSPASGAILTGPATIPLMASASSTDGTIASVTFYQGTTKLGTSRTTPYLYTWKKVTAGSYTLTAIAKDNLGVSTTSAPVSITVNPDQPPMLSLTSPANGFTTIGPATIPLVATASSPDETIASVAFYQGTTKLGISRTAPYQFNWKNVAAGSYILTAVATDILGIATTSAAVDITVTPDQPPVVSITAPANGFSTTGPATIVLSASASSPDEAIKSVAFYQGTTKIGTVTKSPYTYTWKKAAVGTYTLKAVATDTLGIATTSGPIGITVTQDQAPAVSIVTPISGATYVAPASIGLSSAASSPDVSIASVTYYQGATKLSTVKPAPYQFTWKSVAAGTYSITAVATDSVGGTTISDPVSVNVSAATTSSAKLTKPANGTVIAAPTTIALAATASASAGVANVGFYAGSTLLGTATSSPYQYNWMNAPAGVYFLTAVETDKLGASVTSAPISIRLDAPPVVLLTTPSNGSSFIAPASINLAASATTSGTITKVEFYQNTTLLGSSAAAPYQFAWTPVPVGTYSLTAKVYDSFGISAFSLAAGVQVVAEQPPVITLSTPTSGLTFGATANVSLSFNATASTSIAKVEIYRNGALVGTLTSPSSGSAWKFTEPNPLPVGKYSYFARAYDSTGTSADSPPVTVIVAPDLPYLTDFETSDGFTVGSLDGQVGWAVIQVAANVSNQTAYSGGQSIQLAGGTPVAIAQQVVAPTTGETIIFCDFYAEPAAETAIASSTIFTAEGAQFGFQQSGGQGVLQVFRGDGNGGGTWAPTTFSIPLTGDQAQNWVHLTARLDFTKETWDIYANGNMIAFDIPFINKASTYFSTFQAQGDASADSFFDDIYIGPDNPLFADANNDGIDDAWEALYGLSLTVNDRHLNLSGDGIPIILDYINGTSPYINTLVTPPPVQSGLVLDLRADAGVVADSDGNVSQWLDQSPLGNIAFQQNSANEPQLALGQMNGFPAINFNGTNALNLPYNMMQSAQSGEIIGVVKLGNAPTNFSTLWNFGTGIGSSYIGTQHFDDFGASDESSVTVGNGEQITQYYIYDTSIDSTGNSIYRYNGISHWTRPGLSQGFQIYPDLGGYGGGSLIGDIAEVLVYNRVLTDAERFTIGQYLTAKYAFPAFVVPSAPTDLAASAVSSDTIDLSWTAQNPESMHTVTTVNRQTGSGAFVQIAQVNDTSSYTDTGLTAGTSYTYQITVESYLGTSGPSNSASVTTPANVPDPPTQGLSLWLRSTVGVLADSSGNVNQWTDQSGAGNNASQSSAENQPLFVPNQDNGLPVVRFNGPNALNLPFNMMQAAQSGQIIAVVKVESNPGHYNTLWNFGTGYGSTYIDTQHFDDFGTSDTSAVNVETQAQIGQYYVYDTSIDSTGNSIYRYDGTTLWTRTGLPVGFQVAPDIGGYGGGSFFGDIVEIFVYSRVLSAQERGVVYGYLAQRYALPSILTSQSPPAITSASSATGQVGQPFNYQITATNSPTAFGATGLPPGLMIDTSSGNISGTPTSAGASSVTLTAGNSAGSGTMAFTISVTPNFPVVAGMLLWLRADAGVVVDTNGYVSQWTDQSGAGNNAFQSIPANQPLLVPGQDNGLPIVRFNGPNALNLPPNMMQAAQAGQIIAIVKVGSNPNAFNTLWNFGTGYGSTYVNVQHFDDFGTSDMSAVTVETPAQISQYYIYDTSIDSSGTSIYRYNGTPTWTRTGLSAGFQPYPDIGGYGGGSFFGDIVEIFVYDRILSTQEQGEVYGYLGIKYALPSSVVANVGSPAITSGEFASGEVGQPFSFQITASNNPSSFGASGLPPGLSVSSTGLISGTPTSGGDSTTNVTATNAAGSGSSLLFVTVGAAPTITSATSAQWQAGQAFDYQITATNSPTSYAASGLPAGLTLDTNAGLISGTPTSAGTLTVTLTATNATGSGSATLTFTTSSGLVYSTGFEPIDGFAAGPLGGQNGWIVSQGTTAISIQDFHSGAESLQLGAGAPAAIAVRTFPANSNETIEFCDFYAKPAAETAIATSTIFTVEGAQFGFLQSGGQGVLEAFQGDGNGGGSWVPTQFIIPLGSGNQSQAWVRLTARLDFTRLTWDLYANGAMVAADVPFINNSSTYLSALEIHGDALSSSYIDDLYVGAVNPLFADINNDGIDDAWETQYGLSLSTNDRYGDPTGGGVTNIQKYIQRTSPLDFFNGVDPVVAPVTVDPSSGQGIPGPNNDLAMTVTKPNGTLWANAPVTFQITSGVRLISVVNGQAPYVATLNVVTDSQGIARVYLQPLPTQ